MEDRSGRGSAHHWRVEAAGCITGGAAGLIPLPWTLTLVPPCLARCLGSVVQERGSLRLLISLASVGPGMVIGAWVASRVRGFSDRVAVAIRTLAGVGLLVMPAVWFGMSGYAFWMFEGIFSWPPVVQGLTAFVIVALMGALIGRVVHSLHRGGRPPRVPPVVGDAGDAVD